MRLFALMKTAHYRLLAAFWTAGIILAISVPTGDFGGVDPELGVDKIIHVALFAGFGLLWLRGLCPPDEARLATCFRRRGGLFFVAGALFAAGTEVYQHLLCRLKISRQAVKTRIALQSIRRRSESTISSTGCTPPSIQHRIDSSTYGCFRPIRSRSLGSFSPSWPRDTTSLTPCFSTTPTTSSARSVTKTTAILSNNTAFEMPLNVSFER